MVELLLSTRTGQWREPFTKARYTAMPKLRGAISLSARVR
jgi:hypothetical protein